MRNHTWNRTAGIIAAMIASVLCFGCNASDRDISLEIRIVQADPEDDLTKMYMTVWNGHRIYYARDEVLLTEESVTAVTVVKQDNGAPAIKLHLSKEGQEKLRRLIRKNTGGKLGVVINGRLQSVSPIDAPVGTGVVLVTGHMLEDGARRFSRALTRKIA